MERNTSDNTDTALTAQKAQAEHLKNMQSQFAKVTKAYNDAADLGCCMNFMKALQQAYATIQKNLKNGRPKSKEKNLTPEAVEKVISGILNGQPLGINFPEQGNLPFFGRQKEEIRRKNLRTAIFCFNQTLEHIRKQNLRPLLPYTGKILQPDSVKNISSAYRRSMVYADNLKKSVLKEFTEDKQSGTSPRQEYLEISPTQPQKDKSVRQAPQPDKTAIQKKFLQKKKNVISI